MLKELTGLLSKLSGFLKLLIFVPCLLVGHGKRDATAIQFRKSEPDSDTIPLLEAILLNRPGKKILVIASSPKTAKKYVSFLNQHFSTDLIKVSSFQYALIMARTVVLVGIPGSNRLYVMRAARLFLRKQKIYWLYHGLITKKTPTEQSWEKTYPSREANKVFDGVLCQNWIESYRRAYFCGLPLSKTMRVGYPRFYRALELKMGNKPVVLSESLRALTSKPGFKIMYAPTRAGSLPVLPGFNALRLQEWLEENDAYLYLKTHVQTKRIAGFESLGERVIDLSESETFGSLDVLSKMNILITDTSSIMMEAFALDLPVIHSMNQDPESISEHDAIAFEDHLALPGMRAYDFDELIDYMDNAKSGNFSNQFALDVWNLIPETNISEAYKDTIF